MEDESNIEGTSYMTIKLDDVFFFTSVILCMCLASYYKKIEDYEMKKNYGTGLGILVACLVCGRGIYHSILMVWGNIVIIKCCDKKYVHQASLAFTWIYLAYLHLNTDFAIYAFWMYQSIALRVVGLAFEVHLTWKVKPLNLKKKATRYSINSVSDEPDLLSTEPTALDIITYSFYFIGLHKGPYYRWKMLQHHFETPFGSLGNFRILTEHKLKKAFIYCLGYSLLRIYYSPTIYLDDIFYRSFYSELRYLYSLPQLMMYFLYHQMLSNLCSSVCTETGFGIYPVKCLAVPGYGPTAAADLLKLATTSPDVALQQEYNFAMLKFSDNDKILFGPKMADTIRSWDLSTRYWFKTYTYKMLFKTNKEIRSACAFVAWCMWSGLSLQNLIVTATLWVYVHLEREYAEITDSKTSCTFPWNIGFSIMRICCLLYLAPCFVVTDTAATFRYYNSIYWVYHIILLLLLVFAFGYCKVRMRRSNASARSAATLPPSQNYIIMYH